MSVRLAIILHFHEPLLVDPATGRSPLPWVRLRAVKDYYGAIALLRRFGKVRLTVSLTPSLVQQLERLPEDDYAVLALKPPKELTQEEASFVLDHFFHERFVKRSDRYAALRRKHESGDRLGHQDMRDLQVLSTLAWVHPLALDSRKDLASLRRRGSSFYEDDKRVLFDACSELAREILPAFGELGRSGRIELATSAYHHPVLPLLCSPPYPGAPDATDDAREQLARARAFHEKVFGSPPGGLWPPELGLNERAFTTIAESGRGWTIADETSFGGEAREDIYRAHERDGTPVVFRDRRLSDLIAFGYQGIPERSAAADLVSRVLRIGGAVDGGIVTLALDGARAWDSHGGYGLEFLGSLLEFLTNEPRVRTCTVAEAVSGDRKALGELRESSWAPSGDFSTWSASEAWRDLFSAREKALASGRPHARDAILAAEASDWFAAIKDERTPFREEYVALFRAHLDSAAASAGPSRVLARDGGLLVAMSCRFVEGALEVDVEPAEGREAELSRKRIELRLVEPVEARIAIAGLDGGVGRLFACDIEGRPRGRSFGEARLGKILSLKAPLDAVGAPEGEEAAFYFAIIEEEKVVERLPVRGPAWAAPG